MRKSARRQPDLGHQHLGTPPGFAWVGAGKCFCKLRHPGRAHPFSEPRQPALKLLPLLGPLRCPAPRSAAPASPRHAPCFVAKHLLQPLIGPRRWGDRSPVICELQRAQRFIHKSTPRRSLHVPGVLGAKEGVPLQTGQGTRFGGPKTGFRLGVKVLHQVAS